MKEMPLLKRYNRDAEYECIFNKNVMVPMRDGVRLATDIYLPALKGKPVEGKFPALLERTPYNKRLPASEIPSMPEFFAKRGYAYVRQDVRGRARSEGEFYTYINEGRDGYDIVEWIAEQPWSNGKVGTKGESYPAAVQDALARENPPHLTAMFVGGGTTNYHFDTEGTGGAFRQVHNLLYSLILASTLPRVRRNRPLLAWLEECEKNAGEWMKKPLSKQIAIFEGVPEAYKWYSDWVEHADFDEYWQQGGYCSEGFYDQYPDIPVYRSTGHYGQESRSSIVTYVELAKIHKAPTFLQYAPWAAYEAGEVEFGPEYPSDDRRDRMRDEHLKFFDQFLMDMDTGILDEPKVKVFMMGGGDGNKSINGRMMHGGTWRLEESWPLPGTKFTEFYLHPGGMLKLELPETADSSTSYSFDPKDPVPTLGGTYAYPREMSGPWDQRSRKGYYMCQDDLPFSAREDVITFQTSPLEKDMEITGSLTVKLWASSSAVDTDFTAKLIDVYPPSGDYPHGFVLGLMDSVIRARYRESFEKPILMEKDDIYEFTIDLWQVSNLFQAGHRIRLDISSSNFPAFDVNPNTGEKIGYHTGTVVARNTIYHDAEHPSHVVLPVISKGK